ncbi:hypothetical protein R3P38DRAFT_3218949 [Favolaschia claudopus]|uniref:Uncharacterized protein n=1 Tax=Favolaschia claudopus TaxID=2862362 RepID=A0AAW0A4G5_9AGAR
MTALHGRGTNDPRIRLIAQALATPPTLRSSSDDWKGILLSDSADISRTNLTRRAVHISLKIDLIHNTATLREAFHDTTSVPALPLIILLAVSLVVIYSDTLFLSSPCFFRRVTRNDCLFLMLVHVYAMPSSCSQPAEFTFANSIYRNLAALLADCDVVYCACDLYHPGSRLPAILHDDLDLDARFRRHPYARRYYDASQKALALNNSTPSIPPSIHSLPSFRDSTTDDPLAFVTTEHFSAKYTPLPRSHSIPVSAPACGTPSLQRTRPVLRCLGALMSSRERSSPPLSCLMPCFE